ncbi:MAG: hypothetical protein WC071_11135 [Victivallaceae bacterium]
MKKTALVVLNIVLYLLLATGIAYLILYFYETNTVFRELFEGVKPGAPMGPGGSSASSRNEVAGKMSLFIFIVVIIVQLFVLFLNITMLRLVKKSLDPVEIKLKKLENADIFLDLPLYVGLFGTISSFVVITYAPQASRLIAYSSTLNGILFGVFLRTVLLFPLKQKLLGFRAGKLGGDK